MYYRTPDDRRHVRYPSDDVAVPENYGGNVFHTSGGKTTFSPLEEQVTPADVSPGEAGGTGDGSDSRNEGTAGAGRANGWYDMGQSNAFADGYGDDRDLQNSGGADSYDSDYGENRNYPDSGAEPRDAGRAAEGARECSGSRPTAAHGDGENGTREVPEDGRTFREGGDCTEDRDAIAGEPLPRSLPKTPGFLEHFSLPHALGSEELLLLGLMYLTAQKPGDDLWIYLLVLLFCG